MAEYRRTFIKIGQDLAIDFANTIGPAANPSGGLGSWRDLVDFLELRAAVTRSESAALRKMGERDARACAAALDQALTLRESVRALLGAMADRRALKAEWIAAINQALVWGAGSPRLERGDGGWRLGFIPSWTEPFRALAPIAWAMAALVEQGRRVEIKRCANPRCVLYFRDRSRAHRRRWCSMAVCGNRMKVAAHTRRHGRRRPA
jgi:predicted RNA-binding Zn ribbon-like protein